MKKLTKTILILTLAVALVFSSMAVSFAQELKSVESGPAVVQEPPVTESEAPATETEEPSADPAVTAAPSASGTPVSSEETTEKESEAPQAEGTIAPQAESTASASASPSALASASASPDLSAMANALASPSSGSDIAKIGDQTYSTIGLALAAAQDGDTIEVISEGTFTEDLTINKIVRIVGLGSDKTIVKGKIQVYGCTADISDMRIENNTATAYGTALVTFPAAQSAANLILTNCAVADNDTAFRVESAGSSLTLNNTDVTGSAHYGVGLRNVNQTLTVNGGSITGWGAIMTSAGSLPGGTSSSGTSIHITGAAITSNGGSSGEYYGAIVLQESYHGVDLTINNSQVTGQGANTPALDIRAYGSTVNIINSTLRANDLVYHAGAEDAYGVVTLSHNSTFEKVYTTPSQAPKTDLIIDSASRIECTPIESGGTYPIVKRAQDIVKINGVSYNVVTGGSIEDAIAQAASGSVVNVQKGTYQAAQNTGFVVDKAITLQGNGATLKPFGNSDILKITADGVTVDGFTLDSSAATGAYNLSVRLNGQGATIQNCIFQQGNVTNNDGNLSNAAIIRSGDSTAKTTVTNCTFNAHPNGSWNVIGGGTAPLDFTNNAVNGTYASVFTGLSGSGNSVFNISGNIITFAANSPLQASLGYAGVFGISTSSAGTFSIKNNVIKNAERLFVISNTNREFGAGDITGNQFINCDKELVVNTTTGKTVDLSYNFTSDDGVNGKLPDVSYASDLSAASIPNLKLYPYYADAQMTSLLADVSGVSLTKSETTIAVGNKEIVGATVLPANAANKTVSFSSSNDAVASVDSATGLVTANSVGTAVITATTQRNGFRAALTVTVVNNSEGTSGVVVKPPVVDSTLDDDTITAAIESGSDGDSIIIQVAEENKEDITLSSNVIEEGIRKAEVGGAQQIVIETTDSNGKKTTITMDLSKADANAVKDINLGFVNSVKSSVAQIAKAELPKDANVHYISMTHNGTFPCPITITTYVGDKYQPGETVYLYWISESTDALLEEQALVVDANGNITFTINHASSYVVTDNRQENQPAAAATPGASSTSSPTTSGSVKTGDTKDMTPFIIVSVVAAAVLIILVVLKLRHKNSKA